MRHNSTVIKALLYVISSNYTLLHSDEIKLFWIEFGLCIFKACQPYQLDQFTQRSLAYFI